MEQHCLVLNKSYVPIETVPWQNAFVMIFNDRAYAVEYYDDVVKTPNDEFLKPAVIVCNNYNEIPDRVPVYSKRMVCARDRWMCQYCSKQLSSETYSIDHVMPRSRGGRSTFENTVCCCKPCNARKADKTPEEAKMYLKSVPSRPKLNPVRAKFARRSLEEEWGQYVNPWIKEKA